MWCDHSSVRGKRNVLKKILGRKCNSNVNTDFLVLAELWTVLIFLSYFYFLHFHHSYYVFIKRKKVTGEGGKKKSHILRVSHPRHSATPPKLTGIYWGPTKGPAPPQPLQKESSGPSRTLKAHIDHIHILCLTNKLGSHDILAEVGRRLFA